MKITITKGENEEKIKEFEIPTEKIVKGITKLGVFSFVSREVMRVRPPKRNIGVIFNWMTAVAVTDAIIELGEGMFFKKEPEVVAECEPFSKFAVKKNEEPTEDPDEDDENSEPFSKFAVKEDEESKEE